MKPVEDMTVPEFEAWIADQPRGTPAPDDAAAFKMLQDWASESEHWGRRSLCVYCRPGDGDRHWIVEGTIMNRNDDYVRHTVADSSLHFAARQVIRKMGKLEAGDA